MPNTNDPFRGTDRDPNAAAPGASVTAEFASGSSPAYGVTATYVPGQTSELKGTLPEGVPTSVSVPSYQIEAVLGRGGMGVV